MAKLILRAGWSFPQGLAATGNFGGGRSLGDAVCCLSGIRAEVAPTLMRFTPRHFIWTLPGPEK